MGLLACQSSVLVLTFLGLIFLLVATVSSVWKFTGSVTALMTANWIYEGLWMRCTTASFGSLHCERFSFLSVDTYIQACRTLMITSLILGGCGTLLTLFGLKCTQLGSNSQDTKTKNAMTGGVLFFLGGLSSMVPISWYASITDQFFDSVYGGPKYELGYALYLGWAGSLLFMVGGVFLTCAACKGKPRDQYDYTAAPSANQPCIYTKQSEEVTSAKEYA